MLAPGFLMASPPFTPGSAAPPSRIPSQALAALGQTLRPTSGHLRKAMLMEIFDYDNVLLLPRKCRVESRSQCDTSVEFGGRSFKLPVVPANMKTVVDDPITEWLAANGYFYVMHRFDLDNVAYAKHMRARGLFVSISSGVKAEDHAVIERLAAEGTGADYIT